MPVSGLQGSRDRFSSSSFPVRLWTTLTNFDVPVGRLKQIFGMLIVIMTAYKIYTLFG